MVLSRARVASSPALHGPLDESLPSAKRTSTRSARRRMHNISGASIRIDEVEGKGRGVFAVRRIHEGEVIERAPVLVIPSGEVETVSTTMLDHYVYDWSHDGSQLAVALGHGSLFNHAFEPNAIYTKSFEEGIIEYTALRDIEPGEELLINYNGRPTDLSPVWFEVI